ncbi:MAG TPA: S41 family peptidase [Chthoniobacterales bacterium]|jgi:tricorn protease|nr:S41 family peptidase [Chthoniobacterales bacterium]
MRLISVFRLLVVLGLLLVIDPRAHAQALPNTTRLLRFPATNGSQIVFCYAGELYTVAKEGGIARRLTDGPGYSSFPRFSADGKQLAFTSQYDGNTEVYVMPGEGGLPKRITTTTTVGRDDVSDRMGPNNIVMTWENTRPLVVFRSRMRTFNSFIGELYTAGLDGDLPQQLPVPRGGFVSFSPDDSKMAYNRIFREFRTWKHYRGGMADDVWIFDFKSGQTTNVTNDPAQDVCPMWGADNRIYFISDRDGRMNLFSTDLTGKDTKQLTTFRDYDIKFPSIGKDAIVFEQAGYIWRYDLASGQSAVVPIDIKEDFASGRSALVDASKHVQSVSSAPDGQRVVAVARGDLFSVPGKDGTARNLSRTSNAHERDAVWSPDGKWIAYNSDATGENELYIRSQDGKGEPTQLTSNADTYFYAVIWSPDSKKLMWADRKQRLRYLDIGSKAVTLVAESKEAEIRGYDWSPDSNWVAYTIQEENGGDRAYLYSLADKKSTPVTDEWYSADNATFSDDGKYLMMTSSRDFKPMFDQTDFGNIYRDLERVYLVTLSKDTENPLGPRSDEVGKKKEKDKPDDKDKDKEKDADKDKPKADNKKVDEAKKDDKAAKDKEPPPARKPVTVKVDLDGIRDRLVALDIPSANYVNLRLVNDRIFYMRRTVADDRAEDDDDNDNRRWHLCSYSLEDRKETALGDVSNYEITFDGKKMLVKVGKEYAMIDLPKDKIELKDEKAGKDFRLKLTGLDMKLDRHAEWTQIYNESWRQMRDFFYAPNMNGIDWKTMRDKYGALVPFVNHRNDLTFLLGELIGELNNGHAYVSGGERPDTPRIKLGLLGAELSRDPASKAYKIERILPGENWNKRNRSPLTAIGVNLKAGDYILAVDGTPVSSLANIYDALIGTADKQVVLRVNAKPSDDGARDVTVVPISDESPLYYRAWVQKNVEDVSKKTNGQVGYIHIPDMGQGGLNEFTKQYFPQIRKKALIVDVRGNGGGFVSPLVIDRLRRALVMVEMSRNGTPQTNPPQTFLGPMVALCNEFSASDGDIFPFRFKSLGLGKLIGKRTWGGVVGIRNSLPLTDGGQLSRPEFAPYSKDGKEWVIEGHGVEPDIVVDNDPAKEFRGEDEQLDRAIAEILNDLKTKSYDLPPIPPYPDRNPKPSK